MKRSAKVTFRSDLRHRAETDRSKSATGAISARALEPARPVPPLLGSELGRTAPQTQSGALAYRRLESGEVEILLVRKHSSKNWGIPKGNAEPHLTLAENAAKEAFEEAGVEGHVQQRSAGSYRAAKRVLGQQIVIEVSVFLLEVTKTAEKWPEKGERDLKWCSMREAVSLMREPLLIELCARLEQTLSNRSVSDF